MFMAGTPWDGVTGTDRRLATALSESVPILWVDPPVSVKRIWAARRAANAVIGLDQVAPGICRLRAIAPPGFTRPWISSIASWILRSRVRATVRAGNIKVQATVLTSPQGDLPRGSTGLRVYYITDDWLAGAAMMGLSERWVSRNIARNLDRADLTAAVSPDLLKRYAMRSPHGARTLILPNGCGTPDQPAVVLADRDACAGHAILVGQLNERLDLALVEAVADSKIDVVVVGPRTERDQETKQALDRLLDHPNVIWFGWLSSEELLPHLRQASVGLTPYVDSAFNRASFPLKTLDYLAAGLPVVSSDLPAVRWLDTELIQTAATADEFASAVRTLLADPDSQDLERVTARLSFAAGHTWAARARLLLDTLASMRRGGGEESGVAQSSV